MEHKDKNLEVRTNEATNLYDWRKGRGWIDNPIEYDKEFSEKENANPSDYTGYNNMFHSRPHLEVTQEERKFWKNAEQEVLEKKKELGQTLAYLTHPALGKIIALTSLKGIEMAEELGLFSLQYSLNYELNPIYINSLPEGKREEWNTRNAIIKNIAERILNGNLPTKDELKNSYMEYIDSDGIKDKESYDSIAWHSMIQNNGDFKALPYIVLIPKEEAKKALDAYFEEKKSWIRNSERDQKGI